MVWRAWGWGRSFGPTPGRRRPFPPRVNALLPLALAALAALAAGCVDDSREDLAVVAVTPSSGSLAGGTAIAIEGRGFDGDAAVELFFPTAVPPTTVPAAAPTVVSSRILLAVTPELPAGFAATIADVVVRRGSHVAVKAQAFSYVSLPPTLSSVSPSGGPVGGGTAITIAGSGFLNGVTVTIGGTAAGSVVRVNPNQITCVTPVGGAGAANVTVTNPDGKSATLPGAFTYVGPPAPTAIAPAGGPTVGGTRVTITGGGFVTGATVSIAGAAATDVLVASGSIVCTAPALPNAGSATLPSAQNVTVTNPDTQSGTMPSGFTYRATRVVASHAGTPNTLMVLNYSDSTGALAQAFTPVQNTGGNQGAALAIHADATLSNGIVYVANRSSDSIDAYAISGTGALSAVGSTVSMNGGGSAVLRPSALRLHSPSIGVLVLYALNDAGSVSTFSVNTSTGALTEFASGSPLAIASGTSGTPAPSDWVIAGAVLYVADPPRDILAALAISNTGALTVLSGSPVSTGTSTGPAVMHVWPGGQFVYASNTGTSGNSIGGFQVAPSPPLTTVPGSPFTAGTLPLGMADDGATLFAANAGSSTVTPFTVNATSGALTAGSAVNAGTGSAVLQVRAPHLYSLNLGSNDVSVWSIGVAGALTAVSGSPFGVTSPTGVVTWAWGADRVFVLDAAQVVSATRAASTGVLTFGSGVSTGGSGAADLVLSR